MDSVHCIEFGTLGGARLLVTYATYIALSVVLSLDHVLVHSSHTALNTLHYLCSIQIMHFLAKGKQTPGF